MTLLATAALFVLLQAPAQTQQAQQAPKASIEGFVVRAGTNEPIARARITVTRIPAGGVPQPVTVAQPNIPVVTTDAQGRFLVKDLEPGTYQLNAARNGFARQQYGERAPGRPGTPLNIVAGQAMKDVVFRLVPAGTISGRVSDATGEPLPGITVQVLRSTYDGLGRRTFQTAGSARTDDRGEYRVYWITPGRYYVTAGPNRSGIDVVLLGGPNANEFLEPGYVVTYYPGTTDASSAAAVDVQPGTELSTIDFTLRQQQLYRIRGRLFDSRTGQFPKSANVTVTSRTPNTGTVFTTTPNNYNGATGTFELRDVAPGSYWLRAIAVDPLGAVTSADFARNTAQIPIDVSNADVENVVLSFSQGFSVRGRIEMEDGSTVPNPERTRVFLFPIEPMPLFANPPTLQPDETFTVENIQAGDYGISVNPMPPNSYRKSARLGRAEVLGGISISGPVTDGLLIVVGTRPAQITEPSGAASVEIEPGIELTNVDFRLNKQQLFRIRGRVFDTRTGKVPRMINLSLQPRTGFGASFHENVSERYDPRSGAFELRDVPAGSYWLQAQALPEPQSIAQFSIADFIANFAQTAVEVSNADVENAVLSFNAGFSLGGRIIVEGSANDSAPDFQKITVFLEPDESTPMPSLPQQARPDGSFVMDKIQPGNYRLKTEGEPPNSYIKSVVLRGNDVLGGLSLSGPVSDTLEVLLPW